MYITRNLSLAVAALSFTALTASAGTICPGGNTTNFVTASPAISGAAGHDPDAAGTGCNTLITVNANGTVTVTIPDATPYDGVEDNLVGVLNNSSSAISTLLLTGTGIFGLDGDGICLYTFAAANGVSASTYCTATQRSGTDPVDYYGPTSVFSITNANSGSVNFAPGVAGGGGKTFFSLEEPPSASLQVTVGGGTPEPASCAMFVGGLGMLWMYRRRRS